MKCDEGRPSCGSCAYRELNCVYDDSVRFIPATRPAQVEETEAEDEPHVEDQSTAEELPSQLSSLSSLFSELPRGPSLTRPPAIADSVLLAHYCQRISDTFAAATRSAADATILGQIVPVLACQHECVSHAVAALAAMDMWCAHTALQAAPIRTSSQTTTAIKHESSPSSPPSGRSPSSPSSGRPPASPNSYLHRAQVQYGLCLKFLHRELEAPGQHNIDAIMACSVLLVIYGLACSQVERKQARETGSKGTPRNEILKSSAASTPDDTRFIETSEDQQGFFSLSWVHLIRGVKSVNALALQQPEWTRNSAVLPLLADSGSQPIPGVTETHIRNHPLFSTITSEGPAAISGLHQHITQRLTQARHTTRELRELLPSESLQICQDTLGHLQTSVEDFCVSRQMSHRILLSWIGRPDVSYFDYLAAGDICALAVYAHFVVHMILLEDLWWIRDLGIATLRDILRIVDEKASQYHLLLNDRYLSPEASTDPVSSELQPLFAWPRRIEELYDLEHY